MKNKKCKKKKIKRVRNIIIVFLLLAITCFIMEIAPNYKKEDKSKIKLIIDGKEVTKELQGNILIKNEDVIYISTEDIKKLIDENLYYDEKEKQIITSSEMHVAYVKQDVNEMDLNGVVINLDNTIKQKEGTLYIPILDFKTVYNIETTYLKEENVLIIENLGKEKNKANTNKTVQIKQNPTIFSKTIDKIEKGKSITIIEETEKNWMKVITDKGKIGYVKSKNLTNTYSVRQDMKRENIYLKDYNLEEIDMKTLYSLDNTRNRKKWIDITIENIIMDNKDGICFNFDSAEEYKEEHYRVLVEIAPRLREIGKKTAVINNKVMNTQNLLKIVDIVE